MHKYETCSFNAQKNLIFLWTSGSLQYYDASFALSIAPLHEMNVMRWFDVSGM